MDRRTWLATLVGLLVAPYVVRTQATSALPRGWTGSSLTYPPSNAIDLHLDDDDWITRMAAMVDPAYGEGTHVYVETHAGRVFRVEDADRGWRVYEWQGVWAAQSDATGWRNGQP